MTVALWELTMILKNLRDERTKLVKDSRALLERVEGENRNFNQEEENQWKVMNDKITDLGNRIQRFAELEKHEQAMQTIVDHGLGQGGSAVGDDKGTIGADAPGMTQDQAWNVMINAWARGERGLPRKKDIRNRIQMAQKLTRFNPANRKMRMVLSNDYNQVRRQLLHARIRNAAMSEGTTTAGGYTIPSGFVYQLEEALLWFGPMLQVADVYRTETGNPLPWPTENDTGNTGVLLAEGTTVGSSVADTFGQVLFNAYKFSSQLVQISAELLEDSAFDLAGLLGKKCGMRIGRVVNTYLTNGSGIGVPQGIVTGATLGVTCASSTAISFDEVISLEHAVPLAYRPQMSYMSNDSTVLSLRKLKDSYGRYLWQQFANSGEPDLLNNRPLYKNQDMASIATTNKTILAGDFSKFKVRMVGDVRARRLIERYADTDQEAFITFLRLDSKVLDAGTHPIVYMQQP
jgi:HK97 family phage major capsid protein